tara:strand:+ start:2197 stop:6732 length:4536 start_codon:yes stop_codon:yes gene_type:complete
MAKKQQQGERQKPLNKLVKGMNQDVNPIDQPPGSYRFAFNAVNDRELGAVSNELGNLNLGDGIPVGYEIIGFIDIHDYTSDTKFVIFMKDNLGNNISLIGKVTFNNSFVQLLWDGGQAPEEKLNFSARFPIEGEYKINATGEVSIYWTDDNNVPRMVNLTALPTVPYDVSLLDLFPKIKAYPQIALDSVGSSAGTLRTGAYQLTVCYMTEDGAVTSYLDISNPVYINDESEGLSNDSCNAWGSSSLFPSQYGGADGGTPSSKSIKWVVSNLDTAYAYIVPCIVRTIDQAKDAVVIDREAIPITGASIDIIYTGYEEAHEELLAAVQIPKESYTKAKTVAQVDDVLYWGNLEKQKIDIGYQRYANSIQIYRKELNPGFNDAVTRDITGLGSVTWDMSKAAGVDGYDMSTVKGYKRGEVYAFYITWVLKDGSETVAYHIPGRPPQAYTRWEDNNGVPVTEDMPVLSTTKSSMGPNPHPFVSQLAHWANPVGLYNFSGYGANMAQNHTQGNAGRGFNFWQNETETYPTTDDFDVCIYVAGPVGFDGFFNLSDPVDAANYGFGQASLQGQKVRHHYFPLPDNNSSNTQNRSHVAFSHGSTPGRHCFNPQGIQVNCVSIPPFIVEACVSYKIYYLEKTNENMVCLGSTLIQSGRENCNPHKVDFGEHWMCMPHQILGTASEDDFVTPFFVAEPLDLMQTGDDISKIDYITFDPHMATVFEGSGFSIYAKDSYGATFSSTKETHVAMDMSKNNYYGGVSSAFLVLSGKTRVPSGAIFGGISGFSHPIDNEGGTTTMAFEVYDAFSAQNHRADNGAVLSWYATTGTAWPTTNSPNWTDGSNNWHMRQRFCNFMSFKSDVHYGFQDQRMFVYTGYSEAIDPALAGGNGGYMHRGTFGITGANAKGEGPITMGGDVHIGYYGVDKYRETERRGVSGMNAYTHVYAAGASGSGNEAITGSNAGAFMTGSVIKDYVVRNYITESRIHAQWRHANEDAQAFYPAYPINHPRLLDHESPGKSWPIMNRDYIAGNNTRLLRAWDGDDELQTFTDFPTRIIRSVKYNQSGLEDNFRVYLPDDFRDLPRHRGELWKVQSYLNIIVPHMERALYMTKGKETLQMSDASEAYLGTGDLFEKDPAEILVTDSGHAGTGSQWASITSEFGYFFVDAEAGKVFILGEKLEEISMYGMRAFFRDNLETGSMANVLNPGIPFPLNYDNPIYNIGLTAAYDAQLKRFILTKKDVIQTTALPAGTVWDDEARWFRLAPLAWETIGKLVARHEYWEEFNEWTISYDPQRKHWISFHGYIPKIYLSTINELQSFYGYNLDGGSTRIGLWTHNVSHQLVNPGRFRSTLYPFMVEFIDNQAPDVVKAYRSIDYTVESINRDLAVEITNPFEFISVYNSNQESGLIATTGNNVRRVDRMWFFNDFRDLAVNTNNFPSLVDPMTHTTGNFTSGLIGTLLIPGGQTTRYMPGININFIDNTKNWFDRRRFVDKWAGFRLIHSNNPGNLVSLYMVNAHKKISYR